MLNAGNRYLQRMANIEISNAATGGATDSKA